MGMLLVPPPSIAAHSPFTSRLHSHRFDRRAGTLVREMARDHVVCLCRQFAPAVWLYDVSPAPLPPRDSGQEGAWRSHKRLSDSFKIWTATRP